VQLGDHTHVVGIRPGAPNHGHGRARGQALPEFALILPVMLLVVFSIFDLGRAVYAYSTISGAARTASRVAIIDQNLSTDCVLQRQAARCAAADQSVGLGVAASSVTITFLDADALADNPPQRIDCVPPEIGCIAEVTVPYSFSAVTPVISNIVGTINMSSTTQLSIEALCVSSVTKRCGGS
jgi:Flp pilus assembly protein TadG